MVEANDGRDDNGIGCSLCIFPRFLSVLPGVRGVWHDERGVGRMLDGDCPRALVSAEEAFMEAAAEGMKRPPLLPLPPFTSPYFAPAPMRALLPAILRALPRAVVSGEGSKALAAAMRGSARGGAPPLPESICEPHPGLPFLAPHGVKVIPLIDDVDACIRDSASSGTTPPASASPRLPRGPK